MKLNEYIQGIGGIIVNLQAIEFLLRGFLYEKEDAPHQPLPPGKSLNDVQLNDEVPLNALTSYDSLDELIKRYNRIIARVSPDLQIDSSIVDLRAAIAHGRVFSLHMTNHFSIVKFTKPKKGEEKVLVKYREIVTSDWLKIQDEKLVAELKKLMKATGASYTREAQD